jgi:hypothetical protein
MLQTIAIINTFPEDPETTNREEKARERKMHTTAGAGGRQNFRHGELPRRTVDSRTDCMPGSVKGQMVELQRPSLQINDPKSDVSRGDPDYCGEDDGAFVERNLLVRIMPVI